MTNIFDSKPWIVDYLQKRFEKVVSRVNEREKRTNVGRNKNVC